MCIFTLCNFIYNIITIVIYYLYNITFVVFYRGKMNRYEHAKRLIDFGVIKITDDGKVYRKIRLYPFGFKMMKEINIEKTDKQGYKYITLRKNRKIKNIRVHRLIWFMKHDKICDNLEINHKNGIKDDNRTENIELITRSENAKHAYHVLKVINNEGIHNPNAKLSEDEVREIRNKSNSGMRVKDLAKYYKVSISTIKDIKSGKIWKNIE